MSSIRYAGTVYEEIEDKVERGDYRYLDYRSLPLDLRVLPREQLVAVAAAIVAKIEELDADGLSRPCEVSQNEQNQQRHLALMAELLEHGDNIDRQISTFADRYGMEKHKVDELVQQRRAMIFQ